MSGSVNKVILIGNLGKDPELRTTDAGATVATLALATSRSYTDKRSERIEETEWHTVVLWSKLADLAGQYLQKGRKVYIEGRLQTRSWIDQKTGDKRYKTEVVATQMTFLGSGQDRQDRVGGLQRTSGGHHNQGTAQPLPTNTAGPSFHRGDEVPF